MTTNSRYSMLDSMDIRCARCGYENNPQFRFCGMCGAALRPRDPEQPEEGRKTDVATEGNIISQRLREHDLPPAEPMPVEPLIAELTAAQKLQAEQTTRAYSRESRDEYPQESFHGQRTAVSVTGPSFLGLSDSGDDRRVEYLLEDEPHPGRMGKIVATLLVLAVVAGGAFYWWKAGYSLPAWASHTATQSASTNSTAGSSSPDEDSGAAPSAAAPPVTSQPEAQKSNTAVPKEPGASDATAANPVASANAPGTQIAGNTTSEDKASEPGADTPVATSPETTSAPSEEKAIPAPARELSKPQSARTAASRVMPSRPSSAALATPNPAEDSLFLEGQKYLYGTGGVRSDCTRAQQYLTTSANNNNSKAQSTLATMYATGHCAHRDMPLAYHWFARALHEDPRNTRLERDVQIMWDQMSPRERDLALKSQ